MRIIVVDDEPVVAQTLGAILGHSGYEVEIFLRPDEALQCILNLPADLLLTDMCMPSMNGLELALQVVGVTEHSAESRAFHVGNGSSPARERRSLPFTGR